MSSYLPYDALDAGQWQALVVGLDDPLQQVVAQHLEHHTHVLRGRRVKDSKERRQSCELRTEVPGGLPTGTTPSGPTSTQSDRQLLECLSDPQAHPSSSRTLHNSLSCMVMISVSNSSHWSSGSDHWRAIQKNRWCWLSWRKVAFLWEKKKLTNSLSF